MLFRATISIPKSTLETAPIVETLEIAKGIITKIMVRPRAGHAGLAHCTISHASHQIAPSTEGMNLSGDAYPIDWEEYYEFYEPPYRLIIRGWNEDDTYTHAFDVYVAILPRRAIVATAVSDAITSLIDLIIPKAIKIPSWLGGSKE